jgi:hypothetical protein
MLGAAKRSAPNPSPATSGGEWADRRSRRSSTRPFVWPIDVAETITATIADNRNGARRGRSVIGRRPVQHGSVAQKVQMDIASLRLLRLRGTTCWLRLRQQGLVLLAIRPLDPPIGNRDVNKPQGHEGGRAIRLGASRQATDNKRQ